jgi:hypothetical protein
MDPRRIILDLAERLYLCSRQLTLNSQRRRWPMPAHKFPPLAVLVENRRGKKSYYGCWIVAPGHWRLVRPEPDESGLAVIYDLHRENGELRCSCRGYERWCDRGNFVCKHGRGLVSAGLLPGVESREPIRSEP